eukprot:TRINITY_DN17175_c0_g1_i3.p1 TRINITY_DN17175_c0_g1~~TRINITY_DN17175_c0_g1_i3.p1  ORF type:complete len:126 (+),score=24.58 TRINITY_DN17175_c0_g1_i3:177-554(+)
MAGMRRLLSDNPLAELDRCKLQLVMNTVEGILTLCSEFSFIPQRISLKNLEAFETITQVVLNPLNKLPAKSYIAIKYAAMALELGKAVSYEDSKSREKHYLRENFQSNDISVSYTHLTLPTSDLV